MNEVLFSVVIIIVYVNLVHTITYLQVVASWLSWQSCTSMRNMICWHTRLYTIYEWGCFLSFQLRKKNSTETIRIRGHLEGPVEAFIDASLNTIKTGGLKFIEDYMMGESGKDNRKLENIELTLKAIVILLHQKEKPRYKELRPRAHTLLGFCSVKNK